MLLIRSLFAYRSVHCWRLLGVLLNLTAVFGGDEDCLHDESRLIDRMPGIAQKINVCGGSNGAVYHNTLVGNAALQHHSFNGFWSKQRDDVSYNQLQKVCMS